MAYREKEIEKLYYTIGEVAKMFNLTVSKIRFWENEFEVLQPKKNQRGDRFFTRQDIEHLHIIYHLLSEEGYTIEGARKKIATNQKAVSGKIEILDSLRNIRSFLVSMRDNLPTPTNESAAENS